MRVGAGDVATPAPRFDRNRHGFSPDSDVVRLVFKLTGNVMGREFMKTISLGTLLVAAIWATGTAAALAGGVRAPAPLMGAGLPGLGLLSAAGGGYAVLRWRRRSRK